MFGLFLLCEYSDKSKKSGLIKKIHYFSVLIFKFLSNHFRFLLYSHSLSFSLLLIYAVVNSIIYYPQSVCICECFAPQHVLNGKTGRQGNHTKDVCCVLSFCLFVFLTAVSWVEDLSAKLAAAFL